MQSFVYAGAAIRSTEILIPDDEEPSSSFLTIEQSKQKKPFIQNISLEDESATESSTTIRLAFQQHYTDTWNQLTMS